MADETKKAPRARVEQEEGPRQKQAEQRPENAEPRPVEGGAAGSAPAANDGSNHASGTVLERFSGWLTKSFPGHENAFLGGVCGLVVAILIAAIGFWWTLLVALLVLIGVAIGQQADGDPKIIRAVSKFFHDRKSQ